MILSLEMLLGDQISPEREVIGKVQYPIWDQEQWKLLPGVDRIELISNGRMFAVLDDCLPISAVSFSLQAWELGCNTRRSVYIWPLRTWPFSLIARIPMTFSGEGLDIVTHPLYRSNLSINTVVFVHNCGKISYLRSFEGFFPSVMGPFVILSFPATDRLGLRNW